MKTTKRIVSESAKNSAFIQRVMADKKALREKCKNMPVNVVEIVNDQKPA
nr:hypothetical protein [uncultured Arsenicibacter sp.]